MKSFKQSQGQLAFHFGPLFFMVPLYVCAHLLAQLCLTVCDPMDGSPPGPFAHGILQEYWSGLSFPSPGGLPKPGIKPGSPALQVRSSSSEPPGKPGSGQGGGQMLLS